MGTFIHVVMRSGMFPERPDYENLPVEAHFIQMVADSRAGMLAKMPSNRGYVFTVRQIALYGSPAVAEFPGVNARIQVEEGRKTPRSKRRLLREQIDPGELAYKLTKGAVIDMPTARAVVDAALKDGSLECVGTCLASMHGRGLCPLGNCKKAEFSGRKTE